MGAGPATQGGGMWDPIADERLEWIPLDEMQESPHNPRKHFDPVALEQLMESLLQSGQLEPVLVRPRLTGGYELAAGHRRLRAAKLACERHADGAQYRRLDTLRAIVREMDDRTFIETLNVDNLQRDDLHPLEEAAGFQDLMTSCGYHVKKIAARIGKSTRYVYDSLTLLKLIPDAKKLFLDGAFERGHAVILARLDPGAQKRAIDPDGSDHGRIGGLFYPECAHADPNEPPQERLKLEDQVKPVSVREFQTWVDDNVRFRPEEEDLPNLFPETETALAEARDRKLKTVYITYEYRCSDATRDAKQRTFGSAHWKRADGQKGSKTCERSVIGIVASGPGRGDSLRVCVDKKKCDVHWKVERQRMERQRKAMQQYRQPRDQKAGAEKAKEPAGIPAEFEAQVRKEFLDGLVAASKATINEIIAQLKALPDEIAWNLGIVDIDWWGWAKVGKRSSCSYDALDAINDFRDLLNEALPGKWQHGQPKDLTAARVRLACDVHLMRDCQNIGDRFQKELDRRWKAELKRKTRDAKAAPAPPAKQAKAKATKATKTAGRGKKR